MLHLYLTLEQLPVCRAPEPRAQKATEYTRLCPHCLNWQLARCAELRRERDLP